MTSARKIWAITVKEMRQISRDRRTLMILLFVPGFFLLLYGYALNFDIRDIRLAVKDQDRSTESRELVAAFTQSGYFDLVAWVDRDEDIVTLIDHNEVRAALVIPPQFGRDASTGQRTSVQVIVDGDNANTATTVVGYALTLVSSVSSRYEVQARAASPLGPALVLEPRVWYNPELRSALFLVPGLIAYIAMITAVASTALSIVREKESGTLEQVRMAPIGTFPFIVGKTVPYFLISLTSAGLIILASMVLFRMPMRGSWLALLLALSLFLIGALATGLLISTVADSQQVAFQLALLISLLPTLILSGFIFPISSMPPALQLITNVVPARYFLVALRGIVLKGAPVVSLAGPLFALAIYAAVMLSLSSLRLARERA